MKTAQLIKDVSKDFTGTAKVYKLEPPFRVVADWDGDFGGKVKYVVVSTTYAPFSGIETYIFPSDDKGNILDWGELQGSEQGTGSHILVLKNLGYTINS